MWWGAIGGAIVGAFAAPWAAIGGAGLAILIGGGWLFIKAGPIFSRVPLFAIFGIGALLGALGTCLQLKDNEFGQMVFANMVGGAVLGAFLAFWIARQALQGKSARIASLVKQGWSLGEKPHGYS
jgi:hypothetical protein